MDRARNPYRPDTPTEDEVTAWKQEAADRGVDPEGYVDAKIDKGYVEKLKQLGVESDDQRR